MMNYDGDDGGQMSDIHIYIFHSLMLFPTGGFLRGWRLGDNQNHGFTHRRLYTEELLQI
jgi:hypothetical protein